MTDSLDQKKSSVIAWLGLVSPLIIISMTAALYLAGAVYDSVILERYGLGDVGLDKTLQQVLTQGFFGTVIGLPTWVTILIALSALAAYAVIWTIIGIAVAYALRNLNQKAIEAKANHVANRFRFVAYGVYGLVTAFFFFVLMCMPAILAGSAANNRLEAVGRAIAHGCDRCWIYRTKDGNLLGFGIAGDKSRIIIAQLGQARVLKVDELLSVSQFVRPAETRKAVGRH